MDMGFFICAKDNTEGNNKCHHKFNDFKTPGNRTVEEIAQTDINSSKKHHGGENPDGQMLEDCNKVSVKFIE